jgi:hypothetical protein
MKFFIIKTGFVLIGLLLLLCSCVYFNYVGSNYEPTEKVDVFYSASEVTKPYTTIGHAISAGEMFVSVEKLQAKLHEEAKSRGADAIIITGIERDTELGGNAFDTEKQVKATFIRYE